jgi:hypothetical protein
MTPGNDALPSPDLDAWKLFVFRKSRQELSTRKLIAELAAELRLSNFRQAAIPDALVRAGELESGLADLNAPETASMAAIVDGIADVACGYSPPSTLAALVQKLEQISGPAHIKCSHPEGFSYYGLHPLQLVPTTLSAQNKLRGLVALIGIRSVGPSLSAVVGSVLRSTGKDVSRITVRPEGEPYRRTLEFNREQAEWIQEKLQGGADFIIVDEGPGFSGSTFLSVVRALCQSGVPSSSIVLLGTRPFGSIMSGAAQTSEWSGLRSYTSPYGSWLPADANLYMGNGLWRDKLYKDRSEWPDCWTEMERAKYLTADGCELLKFEGFGRYGQLVREHSSTLAQAKFSPALERFDNGYAHYRFVNGRPLDRRDLTCGLLSRMAAYCAFRAKHFPAPAANTTTIENMMWVNLDVEFGLPKKIKSIPVERPVYPDCRMMPHEWLQTGAWQVLKTDAAGHAEGHQIPGPVDVAWDLAGAIAEWRLSSAEADIFLDEYRKRSGDDARNRIQIYLLVYSIFRMAYCRMAAASLASFREAKYLRIQYQWYSWRVKRFLDSNAA